MDTDTFVHFAQVVFDYKHSLYNIIQRKKTVTVALGSRLHLAFNVFVRRSIVRDRPNVQI
jgi:hypothetical protein